MDSPFGEKSETTEDKRSTIGIRDNQWLAPIQDKIVLPRM